MYCSIFVCEFLCYFALLIVSSISVFPHSPWGSLKKQCWSCLFALLFHHLFTVPLFIIFIMCYFMWFFFIAMTMYVLVPYKKKEVHFSSQFWRCEIQGAASNDGLATWRISRWHKASQGKGWCMSLYHFSGVWLSSLEVTST